MNLYIFVIGFILKHFLADYFFQSWKMWEGKRAAQNWLAPLCRHAAVNGLFTFALVLTLMEGKKPSILYAIGAGTLDFVFHAVIDRMKLFVERFVPQKAATVIDQAFHGLTYLLIYFLFFVWLK